MAAQPVALNIGGQSYRVHSDADPDTLHHLAHVLDERLAKCNPHSRLSITHALVYAALTLAADLEQERTSNNTYEHNNRVALHDLLARVDSALSSADSLLGAASDAQAPSETE